MKYKNKINKTKENTKIEIDDTIELSITGVLDEIEKVNKEEFEESDNIEFREKERKFSKKTINILLVVVAVIIIISSSAMAMSILGKDKAEAKNKKDNKIVSKVDKNEKETTDVEEKDEEESKVKENETKEPEVTENKVEDNNKTEAKNNTVVENKVQDVKKTEAGSNPTKVVETEKVTTTVMPQGENFLSEVENIVYQKINEERSKAGIQNLTNSERIKKYARVKVKDMADNGYLASKDLKGNSITAYMRNDGITYGSWGENIGYVTYDSNPTTLAEKFMGNFMNSTSNKDKILSSTYAEIGIGIYKSGDRVYIAQEFIR